MKSLDTHQKKTSFDCQVQEESKFSGWINVDAAIEKEVSTGNNV
jgi:hypothetical protein